jgi:nucleotide-binding universal stress UspA family protein
VREGRADEEVLRVASEYDADLIVVGSHRDKPGFWNRFGSTAERILGRSRTAVLVVHGAPRNTPRQLLAAVDDSETGITVLAHAEALVQRLGAGGSALHVLPRRPIHRLLLPSESIVGEENLIDVEKEYIDETRAWLAGRLTLPNGLTPMVLLGDAAEAILAEAQRIGADLLVIGRERKRRARRHPLGGVTSTILRAANCPVLVIPSPKGRDPERLQGTHKAAEQSDELLLAGVVP